MCICILAPQHGIKIIYGSETVWFVGRRGLLEVVVDILLQNTSADPIDRLLCIVPQQLFLRDGQVPPAPRVEDITQDLGERHPKYSLPEDYRRESDGNGTKLSLTLPDPTDTTNDIVYAGTFCGGNEVTQITDSRKERAILNLLMIGAAYVHLGRAIAPQEARWLRLRICPFTGPLEQRGDSAFLKDYLLNSLTFSYNVSGPAKVRYEVAGSLAAMEREARDEKISEERLKVLDTSTGEILFCLARLRDLLVGGATAHPSTTVEYEDWRTRFYRGQMEPFASIQADGAVRIVGAQPNSLNRHHPIHYYEWASGRLQVQSPPPGVQQGYFSIRFYTRYVPAIHRVLGLVAYLALLLTTLGVVISLMRCR